MTVLLELKQKIKEFYSEHDGCFFLYLSFFWLFCCLTALIQSGIYGKTG